MNEEMEFFDVETVMIPLEDGTDMECAILDEFELDGKLYMVLAEIDEEGLIDEEEFFYNYEEDGEDVILNYIDDEEELKQVSAAYEKLCEEEMEDEED